MNLFAYLILPTFSTGPFYRAFRVSFKDSPYSEFVHNSSICNVAGTWTMHHLLLIMLHIKYIRNSEVLCQSWDSWNTCLGDGLPRTIVFLARVGHDQQLWTSIQQVLHLLKSVSGNLAELMASNAWSPTDSIHRAAKQECNHKVRI